MPTTMKNLRYLSSRKVNQSSSLKTAIKVSNNGTDSIMSSSVPTLCGIVDIIAHARIKTKAMMINGSKKTKD